MKLLKTFKVPNGWEKVNSFSFEGANPQRDKDLIKNTTEIVDELIKNTDESGWLSWSCGGSIVIATRSEDSIDIYQVRNGYIHHEIEKK